MKDLQELFETMTVSEFTALSSMIDKKSLNNKSMKKILDYVAQAYCSEMGVKEADVSEKEMDDLIDAFTFSVALYANILNGGMQITSGRIKITDNSSCIMRLTDQGIRTAESLIKNS